MNKWINSSFPQTYSHYPQGLFKTYQQQIYKLSQERMKIYSYMEGIMGIIISKYISSTYMEGVGFMKLIYTGKNMEVTEALKEITDKKLGKLDKFFQDEVVGNVTFSTEKNRKIIEVTINLPGTILRAEESSDDMYASIDKTVDILERQIRKYKTRLQRRFKNNETIRFENVTSLPAEETEDKPKIVRRKRFNLKPMSVEEAILQMELLGHNFFVFRDAEDDAISVVYKRKNGDYGIIEPEVL